jgi:hypothetical protein
MSSQVGVGLVDRVEAAYSLPQDFDELISHLEGALGRETSRVSEAVSIAIDTLARIYLGKELETAPQNFDKAAIRRLTNALMGTGESGEARTLEALSSIRGLEGRMEECQKISTSLRVEVADFRKAKSYLAHQAKCINAFLKFCNKLKTPLSDRERQAIARDISTADEFRAWSSDVSKLWASKGGLASSKNNRMYQNYWETFTNIALDGRDDAYSLKLMNDLMQTYLPSEKFEVVLQNISKASLASRNQSKYKKFFTSKLKLEKGLVTISSPLTEKVQDTFHLREDLVFLLAQNASLAKIDIEVTLFDQPSPELVISFSPPKEMSVNRLAIDAINQALRDVLAP